MYFKEQAKAKKAEFEKLKFRNPVVARHYYVIERIIFFLYSKNLHF